MTFFNKRNLFLRKQLLATRYVLGVLAFCFLTGIVQAQTSPVTFSYTGAVQTFTVPACVTSLSVVANGAKGGNTIDAQGGKGGRVTATLTVTPGQSLNLYVGGLPFNGGGAGGNDGVGNVGGAGGGATDIRIGGTALSNRIIVAGGGGGGTGGGSGGDTGGGGGLTGGGDGVFSGGGGSQSAGGAIGGFGVGVGASAGGSGVGGSGGFSGFGGGGGGGGGYFGGGGGDNGAAGGGGGSSYTSPTLVSGVVHTQGVNTGNGSITFSWAPSVSVAVNPSGAITAGTSVTFTATPINGGTPTYQWQKGGANISGATNATYTSTTLANGNIITCVITPDAGLCPTVATTATSTGITMVVTGALSVELLDFKGTPQYNGNLLTWTTANEVNNKGFQVERRQVTGDSWDVLGFVTPQPPKGAFANYTFLDVAPPSGAGGTYYRLRQRDNDGKETLSKVVSISNKGTNKLKVYPNPVSNVLTVENTEGGNFQILNLLGQQVLTGKTPPSGAGGLDVSALPQGAYFLKVGTEQVKFVKQ